MIPEPPELSPSKMDGELSVSVVQPRAHPFDPEGAVRAVEEGVRTEAARGARLVLFPEAFVGGYPWGLRFGTAVGGRTDAGKEMYRRYWASAITIPGPESDRLARVAREAGVLLGVGVVERLPGRGGTLYCTLAWYGPEGGPPRIHRKLKPTAAERLVWGEGDGSTLPVVEVDGWRAGGLICWENYMPLARTAMYGKGIEVYAAPTADDRDRWQSTLRHIAVEGRCYVLGCNQYVLRSHYPEGVDPEGELDGSPDEMCRGGSVVYGPDGSCLAGPLHGAPGVLRVALDPGALARERFEFDPVGHYARPDVFRLSVNEEASPSVSFEGGGSPGRAGPGRLGPGAEQGFEDTP